MKKNSNTISLNDLKSIANLANLPLSESQLKTFQMQMDSVLGYVSKIQAVNTKNTTETHQVTGMTNIFREDEIQPDRVLTQKQALSQARKTHQGYFVVPAVLNE